MSHQLKRLSPGELEMLYKAPLLVSILIAGADGKIDKNEIKGGMSTAQKKAHSNSALKLYFQNVAEDFVITHNLQRVWTVFVGAQIKIIVQAQ